MREAKNAANGNLVETAILEPGDDFSSGSEIEDASNTSEETKNQPIKLGFQKYGCPFCSKIMPFPYHMKRHILTHTGEKPFICNVCGKAFNQKVTLKTHSLIHTGEKPFSCSKCGEGFTQKTHLQLHLKNYHSKE